MSKNVHHALDAMDRRILALLQQESRRSIAEIGAAVALSPSACHRRIRLLEERGVITRYAAELDREALGYSIEFFVEVSLTSQRGDALDRFEKAVSAMPEILEGHLMAGGTDYMLRVVAADVADFERIHRERLAKLPNIARVRSNLVIRTVRRWRGYPVSLKGSDS
jgi:DNA-binding Lrp family transcriptional regulator